MARTSSELADVDQLDARLRDMFAEFCAQPIPSRLLSVIDQLEEPELAPQRVNGRRS
jgi:hypothetical protein